eukprot:gene15792-33318_t
MSVRLKIALTIFVTGALTALGVIATVLYAFERFEHETTYHRATAFLKRVGSTYNGMLDMQQRHPDEFAVFLRSLLFFEPDSQLYLLRADGSVIVSTSPMPLPPGYRVKMQPLMQAMGPTPMPYVMGEDPARPGADSGAIIAALPLTNTVIRADQPVAGYLYLVCQPPAVSEGRAQAFRSTFARPALAAIVAVVVLATLLTAWITAAVTRPLRRLTEAVATVERGRQALDMLDIGFLHHLQKLARIGGQRFHIAALPLGIDGVEGQRRLARPRQAGNDDQLVPGQVDIDALEVMLARTAHLDMGCVTCEMARLASHFKAGFFPSLPNLANAA